MSGIAGWVVIHTFCFTNFLGFPTSCKELDPVLYFFRSQQVCMDVAAIDAGILENQMSPLKSKSIQCVYAYYDFKTKEMVLYR